MAVPLRRPTLMGLPSSPAPRSRSVTAGMVTHDIPQRPSSAASHRYAPSSHSNSSHPPFPSTLRTQRSLVNLSNTMQQSNYIPPVPPVPPKERRRIARVPPPSLIVDDSSMFQTSPIRKESVSSISSASSTTSGTSASSLFSARSLGSAISSATSVGDEEEMKAEEVKPSIAEGFGSSLWNRVANAAGSLTISVSKAWEANVATYMGESTPPGQESRLTRALKEYHIAKAQAPSDLPAWLFEERERRVTGRLRVMNPSPGGDEEPAVTDSPTLAMPAQPVRPSANSTPSRVNSIQSSASKSSASNNSTTTLQPMTRVASRLQEMRGGSSNGRVHFMEQVHPRKMASTPDLRGARGIRTEKEGVPEMPGVQPKVGVGLGRKASSAEFPAAQYPASSRLKGPGLAKVDMRGRRPAVNGLPTGVRPVRAGRAG